MIRTSEKPTYSITNFFRRDSANLFNFARHTARLLNLGEDTRVEWAQVGCSRGMETWSLSSVLASAGVSFNIDAYDANSKAMGLALKPYTAHTIAQLTELAEHVDTELEIPAYFKQTPAGIVPVSSLTDHVTFTRLNLLEASLPPRRYNVMNANSVLYHFSEEDEATILGNMLTGLRPGGYFIRESSTHSEEPAWIEQAERFGLQPVDEFQDKWPGSVLRYCA